MLTTQQSHEHSRFLKKHKTLKSVVWLAPGARDGARQQEARLDTYIVYQDRMRLFSKTSGITSTGGNAIEGENHQINTHPY